jgi:hypothetical protein
MNCGNMTAQMLRVSQILTRPAIQALRIWLSITMNFTSGPKAMMAQARKYGNSGNRKSLSNEELIFG